MAVCPILLFFFRSRPTSVTGSLQNYYLRDQTLLPLRDLAVEPSGLHFQLWHGTQQLFIVVNMSISFEIDFSNAVDSFLLLPSSDRMPHKALRSACIPVTPIKIPWVTSIPGKFQLVGVIALDDTDYLLPRVMFTCMYCTRRTDTRFLLGDLLKDLSGLRYSSSVLFS